MAWHDEGGFGSMLPVVPSDDKRVTYLDSLSPDLKEEIMRYIKHHGYTAFTVPFSCGVCPRNALYPTRVILHTRCTVYLIRYSREM